MRHGEARSNVEGFVNSDNEVENHLTENGKAAVLASAQLLKKKGITTIVASPLTRTQETAHLVAKVLGLPPSSVMTDTRLSEVHFGELNNTPVSEWNAIFATLSDKFNRAVDGGETYKQVLARVGDFLFDIERRYTKKNVLIVTHGTPAWLMAEVAARTPHKELHNPSRMRLKLEPAQWEEIAFTAYPHNEHFELDLHRPYIDEVPLGDVVDGEWKRVEEVFDCWFESGSMPYASHHYPFEKKRFNPRHALGLMPKGYPADFIAEGLDQTRGWFYSLIVLGTALFGRSPYKNVIVNGLINASDGKKMSKRLKNYPDPIEVVEKYGADSLRYYILSASLLRGEDLSFKEQGVEEVSKKLLMRLDNVRSFYALYAGEGTPEGSAGSTDVLDQWILSRLAELVTDTTRGFETYELDAAARPLMSFVDDLSTWYLRRSRDRFKSDGLQKEQALATLRYVLEVVSRTMAPIMPFYAEYLYSQVKSPNAPESVHLCAWPTLQAPQQEVLENMERVREYATTALMQREKAGMKVRQPLALLTVWGDGTALAPHYGAVLKDEINVKEVRFEVGDKGVVLDVELTDELREEGLVRDLTRRIQEWRKEQGLTITDRPVHTLKVSATEKVVALKYKEKLLAATNLSELHVEE